MRVDSSGRVGIGTTSPAQRFEVYDATGGNNIVMATQGNAASMFMQASGTGDVGTINNFNVRFLQNNTFAAGIDTSKNFQFNSGYGSVATAFGCRSWVNFDGGATPPTIRASGNVSSVTRDSTGVWDINFTTSLTDANYAVGLSVQPSVSNNGSDTYAENLAAGSYRVSHFEDGTKRNSSLVVCLVIR
jgi:hypothetical protein